MGKNRVIAALGALALSVAAGCSPSAGTQEAPAQASAGVHPVSGLKVTDLTVTSGGKAHLFRVELAQTAEEQRQGLMFRTDLAPDEGMLFPRNPPDVASFWMKNTPLPLDIVFVGTDRRIINIAANTTPYSLEPVMAAGITAAVLEIPGGRAAELGIAPGDAVEW